MFPYDWNFQIKDQIITLAHSDKWSDGDTPQNFIAFPNLWPEIRFKNGTYIKIDNGHYFAPYGPDNKKLENNLSYFNLPTNGEEYVAISPRFYDGTSQHSTFIILNSSGSYTYCHYYNYITTILLETIWYPDCVLLLNSTIWYYTGLPITPTLIVTTPNVPNVTTLSPDIDYIFTYENNINVGIGSVLVVGRGNYSFSRRIWFKIYEKQSYDRDIANAIITLTRDNWTYTSYSITPSFTLTLNNTQLIANVDYIYTYENNVNVGQAALLVTGIGQYEGSQRVYFTINPYNLINSYITIKPQSYQYDGSVKIPSVSVQYQYNGDFLILNNDYILTYLNNTYVGTATVTVSAVSTNTNIIGTKKEYFYIYDEGDDPYSGEGQTQPGGGGGVNDNTSDQIPFPAKPSRTSADTGFVRIYNPSLDQLNQLANYMWADESFFKTLWAHLKQVFENPMDAIMSLSLVPCRVPNTTPENFKILYVPTNIKIPPVTNQFVDVNCGNYKLEENFGSALDYNPYTQVSLFLPFIGTVPLDTDEVMGKLIQVVYRVDIATGECDAFVLVGTEDNLSVQYEFTGNCAIQIPVTGANFTQYINGIMSALGTVAGAVIAGPPGAVQGNLAFGNLLPATDNGNSIQINENKNALNNSQPMTISGGISANFNGLPPGTISNAVSQVVSSKYSIQRSGSFRGNTGYLGVRYPFLIIKRPKIANPDEYGKFNGRPCLMYLSLGACSGYTQVQQIQLEGIPATNPELAEIMQLLKSGVIL